MYVCMYFMVIIVVTKQVDYFLHTDVLFTVNEMLLLKQINIFVNSILFFHISLDFAWLTY